MTPEEALRLARSYPHINTPLALAFHVLAAEVERLGTIAQPVIDVVQCADGRDYAHDTASQAVLDFCRDAMGL